MITRISIVAGSSRGRVPIQAVARVCQAMAVHRALFEWIRAHSSRDENQKSVAIMYFLCSSAETR
jgi:hypothetical protein